MADRKPEEGRATSFKYWKNKSSSRILDPVKISFENRGTIKSFLDVKKKADRIHHQPSHTIRNVKGSPDGNHDVRKGMKRAGNDKYVGKFIIK